MHDFRKFFGECLSHRRAIDVRDIVDAAINDKSVDTATKDDNHKTELMEYIVEAIDKYVDDPRRQVEDRGTRITIRRILMTIWVTRRRPMPWATRAP